MNKIIVFLVIALTFMPSFTIARNELEDNCEITNLKACFTEWLEGFFNTSLNPLIIFLEELLLTKSSTSVFEGLWYLIMIVCRFITLIFLGFNGIKLMIYADNSIERSKAKSNMKNLVITLVFLSISFYVYNALLDFNNILTSFFLKDTDLNFFEAKFNNLLDNFLNLFYFLFYLIVLFITIVVLVTRYFIMSVGVVLFPIGILFFYNDSLKSYGSLIINFLLSNIFAGFIASILLKIISEIANVSFFDGFKVFLSISGLLITNLVMFLVMFFVIFKAAFGSANNFGGLLKYLI